MDVTVWLQIKIFMYSAIAGAALGLVYDVFRISRRMIKTKDIVTNIEDIIFFVIAAVIIFIVEYHVNSGELRFYEFLAVGAGFFLYKIIFKNTIVNLSVSLLNLLTKIVFFIIKIILFPIACVYKLLRRPFRVMGWYVKRGAVKTKSLIKIRKARFGKRLKNAKNSISS